MHNIHLSQTKAIETIKAEEAVVKLAKSKEGMALLIVMAILAPLMTVGVLGLYSAADKSRQVTIERLQGEVLYLADAGISFGAAQLKLDDADGFEDNELTIAYPEETATINSTNYTMHNWVDATSMNAGKIYKVWLVDNDDTGYTGGRSNDTFGSDNIDNDEAVVLVSKGWLEDGSGNELTGATVKGLYKRVPYEPKFAILSDGDITFNGNISVLSSIPSVHTNKDFVSIGNSDVAEGDVTASGTVSGDVNLVSGGSTGISDAQVVDIPPISPDYYKSIAKALVIDITDINTVASQPPGGAGDLYENAAATECLFLFRAPPNASTTVNIEFNGGCPDSPATMPLGGVIYINGNVTVKVVGNSWPAVVLATGKIKFSTTTSLIGHPDLEGVAAVAGGEITFAGAVSIGTAGNQLGLYTASHFEFSGGGNKAINGPMISNGESELSPLSGNITVTYDNKTPPLNGPLIGKLISWIQIE